MTGTGAKSIGRITALLVLLLCGACAGLPVGGPYADILQVRRLAAHDRATPLAPSPDGRLLALVRGQLRLLPISGGAELALDAGRPLALAWSADGSRLAAAFAAAGGSRLAIFAPDGSVLAEQTVRGRVTALSWTPLDELVAAAVELEQFRFGLAYRQLLIRRDSAGTATAAVLHEAMLKPATVRSLDSDRLAGLMVPRFAPLGDELIYLRVQDPPAFTPYRRIMVRNLANDTERELATVGIGPVGIACGADGEELVLDSGEGRLQRIPLWGAATGNDVPLSGRLTALSPDGHYLLADGRLLRDGALVADFPPQVAGLFLADGRLLVAAAEEIFLVSGFAGGNAVRNMSRQQQEQLMTLRAWRAAGLISADQFRAARERLFK